MTPLSAMMSFRIASPLGRACRSPDAYASTSALTALNTALASCCHPSGGRKNRGCHEDRMRRWLLIRAAPSFTLTSNAVWRDPPANRDRKAWGGSGVGGR